MGSSYSLSINENYDPDVRTDMEAIMNHVVKEREWQKTSIRGEMPEF